MAVFMLDFAFTVVYCEGSKSICKQQYKTAGGKHETKRGTDDPSRICLFIDLCILADVQ